MAVEICRYNPRIQFIIIDSVYAWENYRSILPKNVHVIHIDPENESALNKIINFAFEHKAFVIIDEFHLFPYAKFGKIRELILAGGNRGVGWMGITQFTSLIPKSVIGNANKVFLFANHEFNVVQYTWETFGIEPEKIQKLKDYYFYYFKDFRFVLNNKGELQEFHLKL